MSDLKSKVIKDFQGRVIIKIDGSYEFENAGLIG